MKTYIGVEVRRNELSGDIYWISSKTIVENLSDDDFEIVMKGGEKTISVNDDVYNNVLLKYNSIYDKLVKPYNFIFIPKEVYNEMSKCIYEGYYLY